MRKQSESKGEVFGRVCGIMKEKNTKQKEGNTMRSTRVPLMAEVVKYEVGKGMEDGVEHVCGADKIWERYERADGCGQQPYAEAGGRKVSD